MEKKMKENRKKSRALLSVWFLLAVLLLGGCKAETETTQTDVAAQQAMTENGLTRLTRVVMDIGEYSAVVPEQLQLVFHIAVHNTAMDGCALEIHDLPGELGMYVRTIEGE